MPRPQSWQVPTGLSVSPSILAAYTSPFKVLALAQCHLYLVYFQSSPGLGGLWPSRKISSFLKFTPIFGQKCDSLNVYFWSLGSFNIYSFLCMCLFVMMVTTFLLILRLWMWVCNLLGVEEQQSVAGIEKHRILIFSLFGRFVIVLFGDFKIGNMFIVVSYNGYILESHEE